MLGSYLSPLAPAVILLLSAFVLFIVMPFVPVGWSVFRRFVAPGTVGLALLSLLGVRFTVDSDSLESGAELLSGWNFSSTESVAALVVRADSLSMAFLLTALLLLIGVTLLRSEFVAAESRYSWWQMAGWLAMGAAACWLFIAANGLTIIYAVMAFDVIVAVYYLSHQHQHLAVARLFLGAITAAGVILATLSSSVAGVSGLFVLGFVLWLRLGLYPLLESFHQTNWRDDERLASFGISLAVGIFLALRTVSDSLPWVVYWLVVMTMLLGGVLVWLTQNQSDENDLPVETPSQNRALLLSQLAVVVSLLVLLSVPLPTGTGIAFGIGLVLSLMALWVTPALGRPRLSEGAWSWPYLPAASATLSLLGFPLFLGWYTNVSIYNALFRIENWAIVSLTVLAQTVALSGMVYYWLILVNGNERSNRRSVVGIIAMVPFLTPGLGPFILAAIANTGLSPQDYFVPSGGVISTMVFVAVAAIGLGYFKERIVTRLNIPASSVIKIARLNWLVKVLETGFDWIGRFVLRVEVVLEGQHYIGWAIFTALVGALIILLI